jgi:Na+-driven multidrug efflux pump
MSNTEIDPGARFVSGSLMRHVVVMAGTGAIGLIAVFAVDLLNLLYLSVLKDPAITAAVGFAGVVSYFQLSTCIGLTIGISAIVSRCIGAKRMDEARAVATAGLIWMVLLTLALGLLTAVLAAPIAALLGASGETLRLATLFLRITAISLPFLGLGMATSAMLRSVGDARRAMNVTLYAAVVTAALDPIFIFVMHLGLTGGAITTVLSRMFLGWLGWHGVKSVHQLVVPLQRVRLWADTRLVRPIAASAVATNLATPVGSAFVTHGMAQFGALAVSGQTTTDRISPVAFGLVFALTGAVGPILAQNFGARRYDRVRATLKASLAFMVASVSVAWLILALLQDQIVRVFHATGDMALVLHFFCSWLAGGFIFVGCLFVANSSFNNLGHPLYATGFNWGRATLGTIPLVLLGARYGPLGVISAQAVGSIIFGILAFLVAYRISGRAPALASAQSTTPTTL